MFCNDTFIFYERVLWKSLFMHKMYYGEVHPVTLWYGEA